MLPDYPKVKPMNSGQDDTLDGLLSVTDETFVGPANTDIVARLSATPLKSLFVLLRHATSLELQREAEKLLNARLQEGSSDSPPAGAKRKGSGNAQTKAIQVEPQQLLVGVKALGTSQSSKPGKHALPPILAKIKTFFKYCEDGKWILTTDNGIRVAVFNSEADLDQWWKKLTGRKGRTLTSIQKVKPPDVDLSKQSSESPGGMSPSDPLRPMSEKYDMPEYDFE